MLVNSKFSTLSCSGTEAWQQPTPEHAPLLMLPSEAQNDTQPPLYRLVTSGLCIMAMESQPTTVNLLSVCEKVKGVPRRSMKFVVTGPAFCWHWV